MIFNSRNSRRSLLIEVNPFQILAAAIDRPNGGPVVIEAAREFDGHDDAGLRRWLEETFDKQKTWMPAVAGFLPPDMLVQRESVQGKRLAEPDYLPELVAEQFKIENAGSWRFDAISPMEGVVIPAEGLQRTALLTGVSHSDVHQFQQRLLDLRLLPYRVELSLLPLFGAVTDYLTRGNDKRAAVVVVIEQEHTTAYILGKEGVLTPGPVRHGFSSIVQATAKEFGFRTAAEVRERLENPDDELLLRGTKFVRAIGRDLKPLVDSYEMATGQPVGEIYCAYLPAQLSWLTEPLSQLVGRTPLMIDCQNWLPTVNLQAADGVPALGSHWLGALSLIAELPGTRTDSTATNGPVADGPWHVDNRRTGNLPNTDLVRGRFITNIVAITLAIGAFLTGLWQLYAERELRADTEYWTQRIAENKPEADALNRDNKNLATAAAHIDQAYAPMTAPYRVTDAVMAIGRARPAAMRIDAIDSFDRGILLRGSLREPSQLAKQTLATYVNALRAEPALAPLASGVYLTSLVRQEQNDEFEFEITLRLKAAAP